MQVPLTAKVPEPLIDTNGAMAQIEEDRKTVEAMRAQLVKEQEMWSVMQIAAQEAVPRRSPIASVAAMSPLTPARVAVTIEESDNTGDEDQSLATLSLGLPDGAKSPGEAKMERSVSVSGSQASERTRIRRSDSVSSTTSSLTFSLAGKACKA